jgi:hypothetical protein
MKTVRYQNRMLGGIEEYWDQRPTSASVLKNFRWDPHHGWASVGGYKKIIPLDDVGLDPFVGAGRINSIHWWSQHSGAKQWLVWEQGSTLVAFNGSTRSWDNLDTGRMTSNAPWQQHSMPTGPVGYYINGRSAETLGRESLFRAATSTSCA